MHRVLSIWLPPGGHIELHEDPNEAAVREAKEETGLDVRLVGEQKSYDSPYNARELVLPKFLNRHFYDHSHTHEHVDLSYFARSESNQATHEDEGGVVRWFSREDIEGGEYDIVPDVRAHSLAALKELAE